MYCTVFWANKFGQGVLFNENWVNRNPWICQTALVPCNTSKKVDIFYHYGINFSPARKLAWHHRKFGGYFENPAWKMSPIGRNRRETAIFPQNPRTLLCLLLWWYMILSKRNIFRRISTFVNDGKWTITFHTSTTNSFSARNLVLSEVSWTRWDFKNIFSLPLARIGTLLFDGTVRHRILCILMISAL